MQVEMKGSKERTHVPQNVGLTLIAAGLATEVKPEPKPVVGELRWVAKPGVVEGDYQHPPIITTSCSACGERSYTESKKGTAHTSHIVRHCYGARVDSCPADVAAKYLELFKEWKSRSRKPVEEKISTQTPDAMNARFGLQSREELIREYVGWSKRFPTGGR
jgi:hypothetical protein